MYWKKTFSDAITLLLSVLVSLALAEGILAVLGKYDDLVNHQLVPSNALWEPWADTIDTFDHPDLTTGIVNKFDSDGVRNSDPITTSRKSNIIGIFGDSFTHNRQVNEDWTFTSILDNEVAESNWNVVNFGVAGYGLDQAYIRYEKYAELDLKHVFFVFFANDFIGLRETGLVHLEDGAIRFQKPSPNPLRRFLGRFRLTYLAIDSLYKVSHLMFSAGQAAVFSATADSGDLGALTGPDGSSIVEILSRETKGKLIRLSGVSTDTPPLGKPGIYLGLPEAVEKAMSGVKVKVTVVARAATGSTNRSFALAYSTNEVGNSGWRKFALSSELQPYSFTYQVGEMVSGLGDFIGLLPSPDEDNGAVEVASIAVERVGSYATGAQGKFVEQATTKDLSSAWKARVEELRRAGDRLGIRATSDILAENYLSDSPDAETIELAATFMGILEHWRQAASNRKQAFTVVVMPYEKTIALAKKMGFENRFDTIYLSDFMGICGDECNFKNDPHWNEYTNVRVALALGETAQMVAYRRAGFNPDEIKDRYDARIRAFYSSLPERPEGFNVYGY